MDFATIPQVGYNQNSYDLLRQYSLIQNYYHRNRPQEYVPFTFQYSPFASAVVEPRASTIDRLLFDKRDVLKDRIESVVYQIQARKALYEGNMQHIDEQDCGISTKIDVLDTWIPLGQLNQVVERRKQGLEQELHQLHKERRSERVRAWQDVQRLHMDLLDAAAEYRSALRNESILGGDGIGGY